MRFSVPQYIEALYNGKSLSRADKLRLKIGISWLYERSGYSKPEVIFASSLPEAMLCRGYYEYWAGKYLYTNIHSHAVSTLKEKFAARPKLFPEQEPKPFRYVNLHKLADKVSGSKTSQFEVEGYYFGNHPDLVGLGTDALQKNYSKLKKTIGTQLESFCFEKYLPTLSKVAAVVEKQIQDLQTKELGTAFTIQEEAKSLKAEELIKAVNPELTREVVKNKLESGSESEWLHKEVCTIALSREVIDLFCPKRLQFMVYFAAPDNIAEVFCYEGLCLLVEAPAHILWNHRGQLHSATGPAIKWHDGTELFYWQGRSIYEKFYKNPEKVEPDDILKEDNLELRRCYREIMGVEKFAQALGLVELDRDLVNGQEVVLYRSREKDKLLGEIDRIRASRMKYSQVIRKGDYLYFVKVICHSTKREYFLCVPQQAATNAWEAVAWTFQRTADTYRPIIET